MIRDLYIKPSSDPNYKYGILEHNDPIESIIAKVRMILGTTQGKVLGDVNFGMGIEDLVFETRINKFDLEEKIRQQISLYIQESSDYSIQPKVSFGKEAGYDYCVIDIFINEQRVAGVLVK